MQPNVFPGMPAVMPGAPAGVVPAPYIVNAARGVQLGHPVDKCVNCISGVQLRDVAEPSIPMWAKVLGVMTFALVIVVIGNALAKKR